MRAIYKKEMRSYFHSLSAYLFLALFLAISGVYFSVICMSYGYTDYAANIYPNITIIFIIIVPILTMRLMAEERRQKTDQLLLTAPVRVTGIILGKYFAVLTLLLAAVIITFAGGGVEPVRGCELDHRAHRRSWLFSRGSESPRHRTVHFVHHGKSDDRGRYFFRRGSALHASAESF